MGVSAAVAAVSDAVASVTVADVVAGAAVGGLVSAATGGNVLQGAATGALGGAIGDVVSGFQTAGAATSAATSGAGGISAIGPTDLATQAGAGFGDVLAPSGFTINPADVSTSGISNIGGAVSGIPFSNNLVGNVYGAQQAAAPSMATGVPSMPTPTAGAPVSGSPATVPGGPSQGIGASTGGAPSTPSGMTFQSPSDISASNGLPSAPSLTPAGGVDSTQSAISGTQASGGTSGLTGESSKPFSFDSVSEPTTQAQQVLGGARNIGETAIPSPSGANADKSGGGFVDSLGKQLKSNALTLGVGALSALKTPQLPKALTPVAANASQLQGVGKDLVQRAQQGTVTPAQQAKIELWRNQAIAQAKDYYARAGLSDSSMQQSAIDNINQQATAATEQIIQQNMQQGIAALGQSDASNQALANVKFQQDAQTQNMLSNLAKAIGASAGQQPNAATA